MKEREWGGERERVERDGGGGRKKGIIDGGNEGMEGNVGRARKEGEAVIILE